MGDVIGTVFDGNLVLSIGRIGAAEYGCGPRDGLVLIAVASCPLFLGEIPHVAHV